MGERYAYLIAFMDDYSRFVVGADLFRNPTAQAVIEVYHLAADDRFFVSYWSQIFDLVYAGRPDIWDYQFTFSCWVNDGLAIVPARNLARHFGFGPGTTHTTDGASWIARLPLERVEFPLIHPVGWERHAAADTWAHQQLYGVNWSSALNAWLARQPGGRAADRGWQGVRTLCRGLLN